MTGPSRSSPRFVVIGWAPRYGSRDEITHEEGALVGTAASRGWAERIAALEDVRLGDDADVRLEIFDMRPDLLAAERAARVAPAAAGDDLPF